MERIDFESKVKEISEKNHRLFGLEVDNKADIKMIQCVEEFYNVVLPDSYKHFVNKYGGGYLGFVVVYSCDCNGMFYIKDYVERVWIMEKAFLPVVDLETGDYIGFRINDGVCQNTVSMFNHEENILRDLEIDFYDALVKHGLS